MIDNRIKNTIKYPTALVVNAINGVGLELVSALLEQGAYVICIDLITEKNFNLLNERFGEGQLITLLDYSKVANLSTDLRRLDYTFYLTHQQYEATRTVSAQDMLRQVNYLDAVLVASSQFQAKFLLTSSIEAGYEQLDGDGLRLSLSASSGRTAAQLLQYFESLVLEYAKEASLDARVLRLGELMGDGMELGKVNGFQQLLLQAIAGKGLSLNGDGLETDYYLHVLDAAYGLIKGMFSEQTLGQIYQVCYESPITQLTLAYRLQELEPGMGGINFQHREAEIDYGLKLRKLSPNLTQLGWRPRIDLEQAISESLVFAKASMMSGEFEQPGAWGQVVGKLKSLVSAAPAPRAENSENSTGPVSRLIAERQQTVAGQEQGISRAGLRLAKRGSNATKARPAMESWQNFLWRQLKAWQTKVAAFGQITPTQLVMLFVGFAVLLTFYFYIFSPAVVIGKNLFLGYENVMRIQQAVDKADLANLSRELLLAGDIWEQTQTAVNTIGAPLSWIGLGTQVEQLKALTNTYQDIAAAGRKIAYGLEPLASYSAKYVSNVRYRPNSDSYLAAGNALSYETELETFKQRQIYLTTGKTQMDQARDKLASLQVSLPFPQLVERIKSINTDILATADKTSQIAANSEGFLNFLGVEKQANIALLIVDETVPQPLGGQVAGWVGLEIVDGGITNATARAANMNATGTGMPAHILQKYNSVSSQTKDKLNWSDLAYLSNPSDLYFATNRLWQAENGDAQVLSAVVVIPLAALRDTWSKLGNVDVEGQNVNTDNFIGQLALTENLSRRHELIIKSVAVTLDKYSQELPQKLISLMAQGQTLVEQDKVRQFQAFSEAGALENSVDWFSINLLADTRLGSNGKFPFISQASDIVIENSGKLRHELVINTATIENLAGVQICLPLEAKNVEVIGLDLADYAISSFNEERCVVVRTENFEFKLKWEVTAFAKTNVGSYNLEIGIVKPVSARLESSIEMEVASGLKIQSVIPNTTVVEGSFAFTELLEKNKIIELTLEE
jgi:nucleoside-diphosphate-sugar epimerase